MKHYTFYREDNKFDDILNDKTIKPNVATKISWDMHLILGFKYGISDSILGYIVLKYGDDIITSIVKDHKPIPNVDYLPVRRKTK